MIIALLILAGFFAILLAFQFIVMRIVAAKRPSWSVRRLVALGIALVPMVLTFLWLVGLIALLAQPSDSLDDAPQRSFAMLTPLLLFIMLIAAPSGGMAGWHAGRRHPRLEPRDTFS